MSGADSAWLLSVVCPCYNEASCVDAFVDEVARQLAALTKFEIVLVDDGSTDSTLERIRCLAADRPYVRYMALSRNFGKEAALLAGLRKARGELVVTMDVDMQDPPRLLPEMLAAIGEGYDCVATCRRTRAGEPPVRSWFAHRFYSLMRRLSDVELVDGARDYRMMRRKVVDAILSMPEYVRFTKGIYQWVGFRTKWIAYENVERLAGETKWNFRKLFRYASEGLLAFTIVPLRFAALLGLMSGAVAFVYLAVVFFRALIFGDPVAGWPSLVCIIVFIGGLQLFVSGLMAAYLARTYLESKHRPHYFIAEESK